MPEFPHLQDNSFPHLGNVNTYRRKVDFDYGRYDYTAPIKLCNVTWPIDYKHVVNWKSASARDEYMESIDGPTIELKNGFAHVQLDSVMVPVPYDVALTYNYVYMRVPEPTQGEPIDYEQGPSIRTICAFINGCVYHSLSTTELSLTLDSWTTYLPHLAQSTLMLHRGHAPAYATSVDTYLSNPRENCQNLLTPDVNYGVPDVAAHSELLPIGAGEKMLVLASTIPPNMIERLVTAQTVTGNTTPPVYFDTGERNGHQVGVSGYEWHYAQRTYLGMRNPTNYQGSGVLPTYTALYAIPASHAQAALGIWAEKLPQLITSVHAAYVLPRDILTLAPTALSVVDVPVYRVVPALSMRHLADLKLTKAQFGYPTRYAKIAKLYTSPYARLVVSDALGNSLDVRIEDMGSDAKLMQQLSPMAECLRWDVLMSGVASAGTNQYTWKTLTDASVAMALPGADIGRYTLELGIPTYAMYMDARAKFAAAGWYDAQTQRANAINAYQATMRSANVGKENADDSADTGKANADASANTDVTNTANTGATATANTALANNQRSLSTARNNQTAERTRGYANIHISNSRSANYDFADGAFEANLKSEALTTASTMVGQMATGNVVGAFLTGANGIIAMSTSSTMTRLSQDNINDNASYAKDENTDAQTERSANASDNLTYTNDLATSTNANNVANANTNAANSAATAKANASRSQSTAKSNASFSRATSEQNAKAALELARLNYDRAGHAHDLDNPDAYGVTSGDASPDALMRRVVQVRIDTQNKGAISRAGDAMLRYGYIFDGLWAVTDWCPNGHDGCYWEATDVMAGAAQFDNPTAERDFEAILAAGTTVWNDPAKIGGMPW